VCGTAGLATLSPALLSGLAGDAEPGAGLDPGVAIGTQALDGLGSGGVDLICQAAVGASAYRRSDRGYRAAAAGGDIRVKFDEDIVLGFDPAVAEGSENDWWPERSFPGNDPHLPRDTWVRLPSQVSAAASLAGAVSVPLDASTAARVGVHLEAIRKVNMASTATL